jgi:hypothetical protein
MADMNVASHNAQKKLKQLGQAELLRPIDR